MAGRHLPLCLTLILLIACLSPLPSALSASSPGAPHLSPPVSVPFSPPTSRLRPHHLRIAHLDVATHSDLVLDVDRPHVSWQLADEVDSTTGTPLRAVTQLAYRMQLLSVHTFPDGVTRQQLPSADADSLRVESNRSMQVLFPCACLSPNTRYVLRLQYWSSSGRVSEWAEATFRTGMLGTWRAVPAIWIGHPLIPLNRLRHTFQLPTPNISSALLQMSGVGYSTLWVNGARVDPTRRLDPGWTTFENRTWYVSHDVTAMLQRNASNTLGVELGNGWFSQEQYAQFSQNEAQYGPPRLWLWLQVQLAGGGAVNVYSDTTWQGTTGPTLHDGIYQGSLFDSRWDREGWSESGFVDPYARWINATQLPSPVGSNGLLALQGHDPIRLPPDNLHVATSAAAHPTSPSQPEWVRGGDLVVDQGGVIQPVELGGVVAGQVFDLGQNIAGWCRITATGMRGVSLVVRYGETLELPLSPQVAPAVYTQNLRDAASTDVFIFSLDNTPQTFEPPFTYHGFRYMQVQGAVYGIREQDVQCFAVHSETTLIGNLTLAHPVLDQIHHNVQWGQLSNLMSIPTDCSQRDERRGWLGDAGLTVDESLFNFDTVGLYISFLDLIRDVQLPDGQLPNMVPVGQGWGAYPADPNWGTAYPTIAWTVWEHYGDDGVLREHMPTIRAWIDYVRGMYSGTGLQNMYFIYGDWMPPVPYPQTDRHLISSFAFLRDVLTLSRMAAVLNDTAVEAEYSKLYTQLAAEFHRVFYVSADVGYSDGMQTANALALALPGVVPANLTAVVVRALVKRLFNEGHVTGGVTGISQLFPVLSMNGQHDLALSVAEMTAYPSYGWTFTNQYENATTLWEVWDAPVEGPGTDSRNHIMFGSIGAWFYRYVAGVHLQGLHTVKVHPRMAFNRTLMPALHAEVVTVKGAVTVDYDRSEEDDAAGWPSVELRVTFPHNTAGEVVFEPLLERGRCQRVEEGDVVLFDRAAERPFAGSVAGVRLVEDEEESGLMRAHVGSGAYRFRVTWTADEGRRATQPRPSQTQNAAVASA